MAQIIWRTNPYTGSVVWTYGKYGGPGWTGGEFTPPGQESNTRLPGDDPLDNVFKTHDEAYDGMRTAWDNSAKSPQDINRYWDAKRAADNEMLADINHLRTSGQLGSPPGIGPVSEPYRAAAQADLLFRAIMSAEDAANMRNRSPDESPGGTQGDPFTGLQWPGLPDTDASGASGGAGGSGGGSGAAGGMGGAGGGAGAAATVVPRLDPLVLDLDGDGIETTGSRDAVVLFDHDVDGVKTGTGWVKPDDGWLVLDRNGNGTIDSGRELFGVDTLKRNGQLATNGFDALKDLDANQDGKIDAADRVFANLRIWRDLNQDGVSQASELTTLAANSITGIGVNASAVNTDLGNGNVQTAAGSFTRSNGTTGTTGETKGAAANLDLLVNTFYRTFTTQITLTDQAKALPTLRGSGRARDLNEAISLSTDLGNWVQTYTQQTTRQGQIDKLDGFIEKWANTADLKSLRAQADSLTILASHEIHPEHKSKFTEGFESAKCSSIQKAAITRIKQSERTYLVMGAA